MSPRDQLSLRTRVHDGIHRVSTGEKPGLDVA